MLCEASVDFIGFTDSSCIGYMASGRKATNMPDVTEKVLVVTSPQICYVICS